MSSINMSVGHKIIARGEIMTTTEEIRKALIEALKQPMITQRELAEKIGVSQSMISHYASGRKMPSLDTLSRLCSVLDLDANEILCVKRPKEY